MISARHRSALTTRVLPLPGLYAALRARPEFAGAQLNVEGATASGARLLLVQRGNGGCA